MKKTILISLAGLALFLAGCSQQAPISNQNPSQPTVNLNQNVNQPVVNQNINQPTPTPTEQATSGTDEASGIIKLVYSKSEKNYLDIDYIELNPNWAPGGIGGPAYQNNNPKIRTFEISPSAKFIVGSPATDPINFFEFQNFFSPSNTSYQKLNPWDIVIVDGVVINITEHYIP